MMSFDEVNEVLMGLNDEDYAEAESAAIEYYQNGDITSLEEISRRIGLTPEDILMMW